MTRNPNHRTGYRCTRQLHLALGSSPWFSLCAHRSPRSHVTGTQTRIRVLTRHNTTSHTSIELTTDDALCKRTASSDPQSSHIIAMSNQSFFRHTRDRYTRRTTPPAPRAGNVWTTRQSHNERVRLPSRSPDFHAAQLGHRARHTLGSSRILRKTCGQYSPPSRPRAHAQPTRRAAAAAPPRTRTGTMRTRARAAAAHHAPPYGACSRLPCSRLPCSRLPCSRLPCSRVRLLRLVEGRERGRRRLGRRAVARARRCTLGRGHEAARVGGVELLDLGDHIRRDPFG